jgi:multisubunit Na+/H+ antiporter MnhG subunit
MFAALDVVAAAGLIVFARRFGEDTAETRRRAARVMTGVYALIALLGVAFLVFAVTGSPLQYKTAVQAGIFLLLGGGGLAINRAARRKAHGTAATSPVS